MNYIRKTFSITDEDVLRRLDAVDNQSQYVQMLILRDILDESGRKQYEAGLIHATDVVRDVLDAILASATHLWKNILPTLSSSC